MSRNTIKELVQLENELLAQISSQDDNTLVLTADFFDETGELTAKGYNSLKEQARFIDFVRNVKITVPKNCTNFFHKKLSLFVAKDLVTIRKEEKRIKHLSLLLMGLGVFTLLFCYLFSIFTILYEVLLVASWVFLWAAFEKFFFEYSGLKRQRVHLLHLVNSTKTQSCYNNDDGV
ncbi:MAG: hypothetical protein LBE76_01830 [Nitrososphaerota archaeon]|jgi:hypothetical protein|nr:hypothetical protein [Nitrososphaerota archaeon]